MQSRPGNHMIVDDCTRPGERPDVESWHCVKVALTPANVLHPLWGVPTQ